MKVNDFFFLRERELYTVFLAFSNFFIPLFISFGIHGFIIFYRRNAQAESRSKTEKKDF